ncbi:MAG: hypothetical protein JW881_10475 [Spirochaetales bacterium]|nr:hypothetical protein [Spirochaetales bacterium]
MKSLTAMLVFPAVFIFLSVSCEEPAPEASPPSYMHLDGTVTTIAGTAGVSGSLDETGTLASFNNLRGLTCHDGYIYISDYANHTIRKMNISTGLVTTIAGSAGNPGTANGTGTDAQFSAPRALTVAGDFLYVADYNNHSIRKIEIETGVVTTFAGTNGSSGTADGTGTDARFHNPYGITHDGTNLYVTDYNNHTVRKIVIATALVTTFAGSAGNSGSTDGTGDTARFFGPFGITTDNKYLYVAEYSNSIIRKIKISTAEVSTIAGSALLNGSTDATGADARFYAPSGITMDDKYLYIGDTHNHTVRRIETATGIVTTLAGLAGESGFNDATGSEARFNYLTGLANDGHCLYVADSSNHVIRKIE